MPKFIKTKLISDWDSDSEVEPKSDAELMAKLKSDSVIVIVNSDSHKWL